MNHALTHYDMLHTVVRIIAPSTILRSDHHENHSSLGTGFFYKLSLDDLSGGNLLLLISARSVFEDYPGNLDLVLTVMDSESKAEFGNTRVESFTYDDVAYYTHPNDDVNLAGIIISDLNDDPYYFKHLDSDFIAKTDMWDTYPGMEVYCVGYPNYRYDLVNNMPLMQRGIISSMPLLKYNDTCSFLVDIQLYPGSTGSPVFGIVEDNYQLFGVAAPARIGNQRLVPNHYTNESGDYTDLSGFSIVTRQSCIESFLDHVRAEYPKRL